MCFCSLSLISLLLFSNEPSSINHFLPFFHKTVTVIVNSDSTFLNLMLILSTHPPWLGNSIWWLATSNSFNHFFHLAFWTPSFLFLLHLPLTHSLLVNSTYLFYILYIQCISKLNHQISLILDLYPCPWWYQILSLLHSESNMQMTIHKST